jgi:Zn-dependent M28 family amino/carboxypeptidase
VRNTTQTFFIALILVLVTGCSNDSNEQTTTAKPESIQEPQATSEQTSSQFSSLKEHIAVLASDEFEGRAPASAGEELTVNYIKDQFIKAGLKPGAGDSYFQAVPLVAITTEPDTVMHLKSENKSHDLKYSDDMMVWTKRVVESSSVEDSELVFVGYGIVAPEYDWNDYADIDVKGKTVLILVNDPGYASQDDTLYKGNTMTYYGRWTYKYEEAARQGAAAAIIVHETDAAGYGWDVVTGSWSGEQFDLVAEDNNMSRVAVEGWIAKESAEMLFADAGWNYDAAKQASLKRDFKAKSLKTNMSMSLTNSIRKSDSRNVLGLVPGTDLANEYFIYMAHWDHLGKDDSMEGDKIYNGGLDNATGTAGLIELARAFAGAGDNRRSILFVAVTAEESGLLGSKYYSTNPSVPLRDTVAGINMDGLNVIGPVKDIVVVGMGNSELENYLADAVKTQDRYLTQEPTPEKGYFYRSDHFNLAKVGVPVLYTEAGADSVEHGKEWGLAQQEDYVANRYHKPADEYQDSWDMQGAVQDLEIFFSIGKRIANEDSYPNWFEGNEFRAIRDASRQ